MIMSIIIGGICGYIAGNIMKTGFGLLGNIILGIVGGFVGGLLFGLVGLSASGIIGNLICGVVGSCVVVWAARKVKNKL